MLVKTKGIVLRFIKYKESSIIATVYTQEKGVISVIANSVRSKSGKGKIALFQPLSFVNLIIYYSPTKNISRISEISSYHPLHHLRTDPIKASISIFITEILNKCVKEEESNAGFYDFIQNSILYLNEQNKSISHFHLVFLIKLSLFLGFKPQSTQDFIHQISNANYYLNKEHSDLLNSLLSANYATTIKLSSAERKTILSDLIEYYQIHISFVEIKSIEVLHKLLQE